MAARRPVIDSGTGFEFGLDGTSCIVITPRNHHPIVEAAAVIRSWNVEKKADSSDSATRYTGNQHESRPSRSIFLNGHRGLEAGWDRQKAADQL
jgi:hypothetical protein